MKRILLSSAAFLFAACGASAQDWAKSRVEASPRHLEWVTVKHGDRAVKCFIGFPERKDKAPAVLVVHEVFGHTDWVQSVVDEFAAAGYIAIAPDFLSGMGPNGGGSAELGGKVREVINTISPAQLNADLDAAAEYVRREPSCNGKIAAVGFCWGGGKVFAYAAHNSTLAATFVFYGSAPKPEEMKSIKTPIYGFYGGNDARISAAVPSVTEQMRAAGKTYEPVIYDVAGHGFMRAAEDPKSQNTANKTAHDKAWQRVTEVLGQVR